MSGVNAFVVDLRDITIPIFSREWISGIATKQNWSVQSVMKTRCTDDVSGDGRSILARTYAMYGGANYSPWIKVPQGSYANWGNNNADLRDYRLNLMSEKSLITTASFYGVWNLN